MKDFETQLAEAPVFSALSEARLHRVAAEAEGERLERGEAAFAAGEAPDRLHVLVAGSLKLARTPPGGRPAAIEILRAPALPGVEDVVSGAPFQTDALALESSALIAVPREAFLRSVESDRGASEALLAALARSVERHVRRIAGLTVGSADARIASFLLELGEQIGERVPQGVLIPVRLVRRELAEIVGVRSETAYRVTGRLSKAGLIAIRSGRILLRSPEGLRSVAESPG